MRVVAVRALYFLDPLLGAEQMSGALVDGLLNALVATEAHVRNPLRTHERHSVAVMNAMAGAATHVPAVVRASRPGVTASIFVVALETGTGLLLRSDSDILGLTGSQML